MSGVSIFARTDIIIYSIIIDFILLIYIKRNSFKENYSTKLFNRLIISIIVLAVLDVLAWFANAAGNTAIIPLNYWSNVAFLSMTALPAAFGLSYLDYKIFGSEEKSAKRLFVYLIPTFINIGMMIYNFLDNGFFFHITQANQYVRGIGVTVSMVVVYAFFIGAIAYFYRYKRLITGRIVQGIIIFFFVPILGSILQTLVFGLTLGLPSYTLAVFLAFLVLEKEQMSMDSLTGLNTRTNLESRLKFKLNAEDAFTVAMVDLDGFKEINDSFGHAEGDKVLKKVADILKSCTNVEDMVCRYGGDEFVLIIENKKDIFGKVRLRMKKALAKYNDSIDDYSVQMSSGHIYVQKPAKYSVEELMHLVDQKMYQDKAKVREE